MRKTIALIAGILSVTSAFAVRPNLGPAETGGDTKGSWVDVRVTANVVDGIAVNEASPIDFGNLVRDNSATEGTSIYQKGEQIREITPGRVIYRANSNNYNGFQTRLETNRIDLGFYSTSGSAEDHAGATNGYIKNVKIEGIGIQAEPVVLSANGQGERNLNAWFYAYDDREAKNVNDSNSGSYTVNYTGGNLGQNQKLGYYEGKVRVYAEATKITN